jgi:hypothetical protein
MIRTVDVQVTKTKILLTNDAAARLKELTDIWFMNKFDAVFSKKAEFGVSSYHAAVGEFQVSFFGKRDTFQTFLLSDGNTMEWLRHFYGLTEEETFHGVVLNLFLRYVQQMHDDALSAVHDRLHAKTFERKQVQLARPARAAQLQKYYEWLAKSVETSYPLEVADSNFPFIHYEVLRSFTGHGMGPMNEDFSSVN